MVHYLLLILFFIFLFTAETRKSVLVYDDVYIEHPTEASNPVDDSYEYPSYSDSTDEYYPNYNDSTDGYNTTISSMMTTEYHLTENSHEYTMTPWDAQGVVPFAQDPNSCYAQQCDRFTNRIRYVPVQCNTASRRPKDESKYALPPPHKKCVTNSDGYTCCSNYLEDIMTKSYQVHMRARKRRQTETTTEKGKTSEKGTTSEVQHIITAFASPNLPPIDPDTPPVPIDFNADDEDDGDEDDGDEGDDDEGDDDEGDGGEGDGGGGGGENDGVGGGGDNANGNGNGNAGGGNDNNNAADAQNNAPQSQQQPMQDSQNQPPQNQPPMQNSQDQPLQNQPPQSSQSNPNSQFQAPMNPQSAQDNFAPEQFPQSAQDNFVAEQSPQNFNPNPYYPMQEIAAADEQPSLEDLLDRFINLKLKDSVSIEPIIKIEHVIDEGIYAPETEDGNIVVNDVVASCYTDIDQGTLFDVLLKVNFYV
uniref:Hint domain-containing protein n=1 Tax=Acrobeloides nanus TaxID=290746 RepID=A0A914D8K6_9BILA